MDGLTLLAEARKSGLTVSAKGGRLVVRGPRRLGGLAQNLLARKDDVLAALADEDKATATEAELVGWLVSLFTRPHETDQDGILTGPDGRRWPIAQTVRRLIDSWDRVQGDTVRRGQWLEELREFHKVYTRSAVRWEREPRADLACAPYA